MKKASGVLFLLGAALLWGVAFVAQDVGLEHIEPFTFTAVRCFLGGIALLIIALISDLLKKKKNPETLSPEEKKTRRKNLIISGLACGAIMACATNLQQIGLVYTTAGKSGFITACYIVLVPIIGLFFRKKCPITVWIAVVLAVVGLYFLCLSDGFVGFNKGDAITFGCTVAFAFHIIAVDYFVENTDGIKLACAQCFVCSAISAVFMFIFEHPTMDGLLKAYIPLLYTGVMSAGVAYMFQILGQKRLSPTVASLIMSLESVISVIAAWLILDQKLSPREIIGCVVIFAAIVLAQLPKDLFSKLKIKNK